MFCNKFKKKIKALMATVTEQVFSKSELALKVTTGLRSVLQSKVADLITAVIPGDLDAYIRAQLIDALNYAIISFEAITACKDAVGLEGKLECLKSFLEARYPNEVESILIKLAALMTRYLDGQRLPQNNYDVAAQISYTLSK